MSVDIKVKRKDGLTLYTKNKHIEDDISISLDSSLFDQDYSNEDGLITRTLTYYKNDRVTEIGARVFQNYMTELRLDFPNAISTGENSFYGSKGLMEVNLPKLVTMGANAFYQVINLRVLNLPSVETVPASSCRYSTALEIFYAPKLKKIESAVFADCTNLKALIIGGTTTMVNTNALVRTAIESGTGYIYVPDTDVESVKGATNFTTYATQIKGWSEIPQEIREELGI